MIFSDRQDSHDKRVDKILERGEIEPAMQTNFNLVGIRRRLNNIEMAAWAIVALGRVPDGGVASWSHLDAGFGRAGQAATAGRLTMGSSLIGAMLSSVM